MRRTRRRRRLFHLESFWSKVCSNQTFTQSSHGPPLQIHIYIKLNRGVLFWVYNSEKIIFCGLHSPLLSKIKCRSRDQWWTLKQDQLNFWLKDCKIKTPTPVQEVEIMDIGCHICILSFWRVKMFTQISFGSLAVELYLTHCVTTVYTFLNSVQKKDSLILMDFNILYIKYMQKVLVKHFFHYAI